MTVMRSIPLYTKFAIVREINRNDKNILAFNVCYPDPFQNFLTRPDRCFCVSDTRVSKRFL
jgi:hypothetical protein